MSATLQARPRRRWRGLAGVAASAAVLAGSLVVAAGVATPAGAVTTHTATFLLSPSLSPSPFNEFLGTSCPSTTW